MNRIMDTISERLQGKLQSLVSYLSQITDGFESIAEEIEHINLKTAMIALSVESKQYAEEISDQLQKINITIPSNCSDRHWPGIEIDSLKRVTLSKGGEIIVFCNNCEMDFNKLYGDVLQEHFTFTYLQDIITYQFYSTQYAFKKIRLLNTLRFSKQKPENQI